MRVPDYPKDEAVEAIATLASLRWMRWGRRPLDRRAIDQFPTRSLTG
jgi:hypothetical protein